MRRRRKVDLIVGVWYAPRVGKRPRGILAMSGGHVLYSCGGERHGECLETTFRRWLRRSGATRVKAQRPEPSASVSAVAE